MLGAVRRMVEACQASVELFPGIDPEDFLVLLGLLWRILPNTEGEGRTRRRGLKHRGNLIDFSSSENCRGVYPGGKRVVAVIGKEKSMDVSIRLLAMCVIAVASIGILVMVLEPPRHCPKCKSQLPRLRMPRSVRELFWGGWHCPVCASEVSRSGQLIH